MISTAKVYQRVNQMLKSGTSGYQSSDEFNSDMYSTFLDILNTLCNNYEKNGNVTDLMNKEGLIVSLAITTEIDGTFEFNEDHYRTFPIMVPSSPINIPVRKINTNSVGMSETSPIRGFDASKKRYGYYLTNGKFQLLPRAETDIIFTYCIRPEIPVLVLTVDDDDYEVVDAATTDIKLPENLFNLFCYEMMVRAGQEMKEQASQQYALMGINKEKV